MCRGTPAATRSCHCGLGARQRARRAASLENKRQNADEGTIKRPSDVHQYRRGSHEDVRRDWRRFCTRPAKISARQYRTMLDCRHYGGHCRRLDMSPVASGIQAAISWPSLPLISPPSLLPFRVSPPFANARDAGTLTWKRTNLFLRRMIFSSKRDVCR